MWYVIGLSLVLAVLMLRPLTWAQRSATEVCWEVTAEQLATIDAEVAETGLTRDEVIKRLLSEGAQRLLLEQDREEVQREIQKRRAERSL